MTARVLCWSYKSEGVDTLSAPLLQDDFALSCTHPENPLILQILVQTIGRRQKAEAKGQ